MEVSNTGNEDGNAASEKSPVSSADGTGNSSVISTSCVVESLLRGSQVWGDVGVPRAGGVDAVGDGVGDGGGQGGVDGGFSEV